MKKLGVNSDEILAKAHKAVGLLPQVSGVQGQTIRTMMCITLSGFDILMTEQFGYLVKVFSTLCQPCSKVLTFSYLPFLSRSSVLVISLGLQRIQGLPPASRASFTDLYSRVSSLRR